jgi:membrane protease YdiL (CAAX protease family)
VTAYRQVVLRTRLVAAEVFVVVGFAIGLSALRSILYFLQAVLTPGGLAAQQTTLNGSLAPAHPWIDLGLQLVFIAGLLAPVALVLLLVARDGEPTAWVGLDLGRLRPDVLLGLAVAAVVGGLGLAAYLVSHLLGLSLTVVPSSLPAQWWRIPVLVLSSVANAALEEVVMVGYLVRRLEQLRWPVARAVAFSAVLRGCYHLYQGVAGALGNLVMGALFAGYFARRRTVVPQIVAHASIDIVAFVGYTLLAGHVSWLPSPT